MKEEEKNTGRPSDTDCEPPSSSASSSRKDHRKEKDGKDIPDSLRAAIGGGGVLSVNRQRAMSQWDDMTDALMAKYGGGSKKTKKESELAAVGKKRSRSKRDDDDTAA